MASKDNKPAPSGEQSQATLKVSQEEKIEVEITTVIRIYARNLDALKKSFETWSGEWE